MGGISFSKLHCDYAVAGGGTIRIEGLGGPHPQPQSSCLLVRLGPWTSMVPSSLLCPEQAWLGPWKPRAESSCVALEHWRCAGYGGPRGLRGPAGNAEEPGRGLSSAARAAHVPTPSASLFSPDLRFSPFSLLLPHPWPCFSVCLDFLLSLHSFQFSSVAQSCPTPCDPMDCSTLGLPVHHQLLEFTQTHVH